MTFLSQRHFIPVSGSAYAGPGKYQSLWHLSTDSRSIKFNLGARIFLLFPRGA